MMFDGEIFFTQTYYDQDGYIEYLCLGQLAGQKGFSPSRTVEPTSVWMIYEHDSSMSLSNFNFVSRRTWKKSKTRLVLKSWDIIQ